MMQSGKLIFSKAYKFKRDGKKCLKNAETVKALRKYSKEGIRTVI